MNTVSYIYPPDAPADSAAVFVLAGAALIFLLADACLPRLPKKWYAPMGFLVCSGCFCAALSGRAYLDALVTGMAGLCLLLLYDYRSVVYASVAGPEKKEGPAELTSLMLLATAAVLSLERAKDLILLFVSVEALALPSYAMVGFFRRNRGSVEAGVKYLVLGALSTAFMVMGMAWFFGTTGTFDLAPSVFYSAVENPFLNTGAKLSLALLLLGAFFKVGAVPMHSWIPDVYQGAPTPVTAFLATVSKIAGFVMLLKICLLSVVGFDDNTATGVGLTSAVILAIVSIATLLVGNLGAIPQRNVKRLLGYSSIGQAGFILVFFVDRPSPLTVFSVLEYLLAYSAATVGALLMVQQVRMRCGSEELSAFRGLGRTNPRLAFLTTVCFASLAGVPFTGGFIAKALSFMCAMDNACMYSRISCIVWVLPAVMVIGAGAGFYYYFKVLQEMFWGEPAEGMQPLRCSGVTVGVMVFVCVLLVVVGTVPMFPMLLNLH